jgi:hypothetical protein
VTPRRLPASAKRPLRRRIERGTVDSEVRDGRRLVLVESVRDDPAPRTRGVDVAPLLARLEQLASDNGRLRALTQIAESTEQRLTSELVEQRARVAELEAREAELEAAGPIRAWRLARARRR